MDKEPFSLFPRWSALLFLRRFIAQPGQIGSVAPSSHFLVQEMLKLSDWPAVTDVAELGAGTGVVTEELLRKISPTARLSVFELDQKLREKIENKLEIDVFPDACDLAQVIKPRSLDVIISSLPWTTLPKEVSVKILQGVLTCLKPSGQFIAYQYSRQMYRLFCRLFESVRISFVFRNIPPAFVYNCHTPRNHAEKKAAFFFAHKLGGRQDFSQ